MEPKREMSHARTKPWGPGDARQPRIEEIFHDKLSQLGHACHLVERPGDSGRDPKPCSPGPEAEAREFPIVANPKPGTPQKSGRGLTVQQGHNCSCSSLQSRIHPLQKAATGCWP